MWVGFIKLLTALMTRWRDTESGVLYPCFSSPPSSVSLWQWGHWLQGFSWWAADRASIRPMLMGHVFVFLYNCLWVCVLCMVLYVTCVLRLTGRTFYFIELTLYFKYIKVLAAVQHKKDVSMRAGPCPCPLTKTHQVCIYSGARCDSQWLSVKMRMLSKRSLQW